MPLRPFRCYRKLENRPYPQNRFVRGVPGSKIVTYDMGGRTGKFPVKANLLAKESGQIRHNALEAARVMANRYLMKEFGKNGYHLRIVTYPHHVLRENAMATGAGADRYQTGMRGSFGRPVGYAARVGQDQPVISVWVYADKESQAKEALRRAKMKLPIPCHMNFEYFSVDETTLQEIAVLERIDDEKEARREAERAAIEAAEAAAAPMEEAEEEGGVPEKAEEEAEA
jgi:large subunit ribosomal protein L10e